MTDDQSRGKLAEGVSAAFWGTRGSIAAPGRESVVYGGNTSCLEVTVAWPGRKIASIVDAGTGLRALGDSRAWREGDIRFAGRPDYTVIGRTVNVAQRAQAALREHMGDAIVALAVQPARTAPVGRGAARRRPSS